MNGYPDRFFEKKWRELEDVPIDYSDPEEPDGVLDADWLHSKDLDFGGYIFQKVEHDLDILEYQIGILDTLIDLWQLQEF